MALQELRFQFEAPEAGARNSLARDWSHTGVVGSGDLEILLRRRAPGSGVSVKITTPVRGFDDVWEKVLARFVQESGADGLQIEINDNNATPFVVSLRLKQALLEAQEEMP